MRRFSLMKYSYDYDEIRMWFLDIYYYKNQGHVFDKKTWEHFLLSLERAEG